jgi:hypothetical protein
MIKVTQKTQYFIDGEMVLRPGKKLADELGVNITTLRRWTAENPQFPNPIYTEMHGSIVVGFYPYYSSMKIIEEKMAEYTVNCAKGIGRPKKV